ncbi:DUF3616 domain-containing protein [Psychrobacter frigidicola]|uniref:DUF3616 domain-containing protein n=1 Tax=Psychrobacter frigidicola TaxID=45611 RepID=A0A5C7A8K2_9GAMM|nr:DUF3616 domain-containing protein [Psychrobacter frigidicola]TXD97080.1 DUF3616 domain-containing protein [Psychrobacter frigidicola]
MSQMQSPIISSSVLRLAIIASILSVVIISLFLFFYPSSSVNAAEASPSLNDGLGTFSNIYEPSAVLQLPDGRVLVVEDEEHRALNILTISDKGSFVENADANLKLSQGFEHKLDDLEGLTADHNGFIYVTTSHSSLKNGKRRHNREQLIRFRVNGDTVQDVSTVKTLRDELTQSKPIIAAIKAKTGKAPDFDTLNIEGLTYAHKTDDLLLGLRAPMAGESAIIIAIENPAEVFETNAAPIFGKPIFLNLEGGGIRSLHFSTILNKYVIANEVPDAKGKNYSKIWTWSGNPKDAPVFIDLPELSDLKNIEGIDSVKVNGVAKLLFTADEGDEKKEIPAKYRFVDEAKFK